MCGPLATISTAFWSTGINVWSPLNHLLKELIGEVHRHLSNCAARLPVRCRTGAPPVPLAMRGQAIRALTHVG